MRSSRSHAPHPFQAPEVSHASTGSRAVTVSVTPRAASSRHPRYRQHGRSRSAAALPPIPRSPASLPRQPDLSPTGTGSLRLDVGGSRGSGQSGGGGGGGGSHGDLDPTESDRASFTLPLPSRQSVAGSSGRSDESSGRLEVPSGRSEVSPGRLEVSFGRLEVSSGRSEGAFERLDGESGRLGGASGRSEGSLGGWNVAGDGASDRREASGAVRATESRSHAVGGGIRPDRRLEIRPDGEPDDEIRLHGKRLRSDAGTSWGRVSWAPGLKAEAGQRRERREQGSESHYSSRHGGASSNRRGGSSGFRRGASSSSSDGGAFLWGCCLPHPPDSPSGENKERGREGSQEEECRGGDAWSSAWGERGEGAGGCLSEAAWAAYLNQAAPQKQARRAPSSPPPSQAGGVRYLLYRWMLGLMRRMKIPVIHPYSRFRRDINLVVGACILYNMWEILFQLAFDLRSTGPWLILDSTLSAIYLVDVLLGFKTGYVTRERHVRTEDGIKIMQAQHIVMEQRRIVWHYLRTWFLLDLLSSLPMDLVISLTTASSSGFWISTVFRLLKLFRMRRLLNATNQLRTSSLSSTWMELTVLILQICMFCHLGACAFAMIGRLEPAGQSWLANFFWNDDGEARPLDTASPVVAYVAAVYWSMVTLASVGYGDIYPQDTLSERIFGTVYNLLAAIMLGYAVGQITSLIYASRERRENARQRFGTLHKFIEKEELPEWLANRLMVHLTRQWQAQLSQKFDEFELMGSLTVRRETSQWERED
ncbi:hypothetical protein CLOM_g7543 [Closterium sp. NIES-68]|nr:hypothetical protein CLOM_g7543 [Closterium sp. NIES-68]GJP80344.1 hypothetical protein CLOP_g10557 [Closterium sp. NIES-67]